MDTTYNPADYQAFQLAQQAISHAARPSEAELLAVIAELAACIKYLQA